MKAIVRHVYGSPDVLRLEDVPTPAPDDDEVLVRVRASSINRTDLESVTGRPAMYRVFMGVRRPRSKWLGLDAAGEVEAVGAGVTNFKRGDRVYADLLYDGNAAFAEFACAREKAWRPMPEDVDFETAATLPASAVLALQGLGGRDSVRPGQKVLIIGASGAVGLFAVQLAKRAGAEVTGVTSGAKFDLVRSVGADHVIDYDSEDYTRGDRQYDRILDALAIRSVIAVRRLLAPNGIYRAHGGRSSGGLLQAAFVGPLLSVGRTRSMGIVVGRPNDAADLATVGELVQAGRLVPVIDRRYTLAQVPEALHYFAAGKARGKLVITV